MTTFIITLNSIAIAYLLFKQANYFITIQKERTFINKTPVSIRFVLWRKIGISYNESVYSISIPVKNKRKVTLKEEVDRMISKYSRQAKLQTLTAKFSWLKTWDEVKQFEKDYSIVDAEVVKKLISEFSPKA